MLLPAVRRKRAHEVSCNTVSIIGLKSYEIELYRHMNSSKACRLRSSLPCRVRSKTHRRSTWRKLAHKGNPSDCQRVGRAKLWVIYIVALTRDGFRHQVEQNNQSNALHVWDRKNDKRFDNIGTCDFDALLIEHQGQMGISTNSSGFDLDWNSPCIWWSLWPIWMMISKEADQRFFKSGWNRSFHRSEIDARIHREKMLCKVRCKRDSAS